MGNLASYFTTEDMLEEYIGQINEKPVDSNQQTPARCNKTNPGTNFCFDPRSPTFNIDRTPIVVENEVKIEGPDDPRSPSCEIIRTPVGLPAFQTDNNLAAMKEREDLKQVLNFTDLDSLSLSNIEDDQTVNNEGSISVNTEEPVLASSEETIDFSSLVIAASSTPAPSPAKPINKIKRPVSTVVDENSFSKSPMSGGSANSARPRIPFGDVNRPSLASPRLHLQNKQKHLVRSEILQHQQYQRYGNKSD